MDKALKLLLALITVIFIGFAQFEEEEESPGPDTPSTSGEYAKEIKERKLELPKCSKPLGTIVARSFKCKAAACQGGRIILGGNYIQLSPQALGEGLADMLVTALAQTGCFKVLEREALKEIQEELQMLGIQPKQTLKGADFLIIGSITALELNASGMGGGGVVIPLPIGGLGIKAGKSKAHIGLDIRIVRVRDAEILTAKTVEGKSERWKFGLGAGGLLGTTIAGGWFEAFKNTPLEEATRDLIARAVTLIINEVRPYAVPTPSTPQQPVVQPSPQPAPQPVSQPTHPEPIVKRPSTTPAGDGVVRRSSKGFRHGDKVLWQENFANCDVVPTSVNISRGTAECVEFAGKKWVAAIKGTTVIDKTVSGFKPSNDWALEFKIYMRGKTGYGETITFFLDRRNSVVSLKAHQNGDISVSGKALPRISSMNNPHTVGLLKKGNTLSVFVDGKRWGTIQVDSIALSRYDGKLIFELFADDIELGDYAFITDIKLSTFSR